MQEINTHELFELYRDEPPRPDEALEMRAFRAMPEDEAEEMFTRQMRLYSDLEQTRRFLSNLDNKLLFPTSTYEPVKIQYIILDEETDAAEQFDSIATRVQQDGGTIEHRDCRQRYGTVQHVARLPMGTGTVVYEALWIEPIDTKKED